MTAQDVSGDDYLGRAEAVAAEYRGCDLVTDEAELLLGCLCVLLSIARNLHRLLDEDQAQEQRG